MPDGRSGQLPGGWGVRGASEGKSTTIANLAVALAQAGQRVVIVCCDLRRPRIHEFFGLSNTVGFTSVLLGDTPLSAPAFAGKKRAVGPVSAVRARSNVTGRW